VSPLQVTTTNPRHQFIVVDPHLEEGHPIGLAVFQHRCHTLSGLHFQIVSLCIAS